MIYSEKALEKVYNLTLGGMDLETIKRYVNKEENALIVKITPLEIMQIITDHFKCSIDDVKSKTREANVVLARKYISFFLMRTLDLSDTQAGRYMNFRRLSARHHNITVQGLIETDLNRRLDLEKIRNRIREKIEV